MLFFIIYGEQDLICFAYLLHLCAATSGLSGKIERMNWTGANPMTRVLCDADKQVLIF